MQQMEQVPSLAFHRGRTILSCVIHTLINSYRINCSRNMKSLSNNLPICFWQINNRGLGEMLSLLSFQKNKALVSLLTLESFFSSHRSSHLHLKEADIYIPFSSYRAYKAVPTVPSRLRLRCRHTL